MQKNDPRYLHMIRILREELVPAMGCTEPIAIAYGAARARSILGSMPTEVEVMASGNIIKNVKSVVVPNTGGLKGIEAAAAAGIVAGQADRILEVISEVTQAQREAITGFLASCPIRVVPDESDVIFSITLTLRAGAQSVRLVIRDYHTHIVYIEHNGEVLLQDGKASQASAESELTDRSVLSVEGIVDFAQTCDPDDIRALVEPQIEYNYAIAEEGMRGTWGACIGRVIRDCCGTEIWSRARYMAAAASDARMSGCEMPVIIVSGSGNQGITACVPVVEYAKHLQVSRETMLRAVLLSDLLTIHLKTGIGRLSAYCGAVSAGCSAGAAIAYLHGGGLREIEHTLVNSLAIASGMICDGAKEGCANKVQLSSGLAVKSAFLAMKGMSVKDGDGIVGSDLRSLFENLGHLVREGMENTNGVIVEIMSKGSSCRSLR